MCEILENQHTTKWKQRTGVLSTKLKNPVRVVVCLFLFCCCCLFFVLGGGGGGGPLLATSGAVSSAK